MSDVVASETPAATWLASAEFRRRLLVTFLALAAFHLGQFLPLYGVNNDVWRSISADASVASSAGLSRLSIFSLGITPFLSAVLIWEVLRLCIPPLRRWVNRSDEARTAVQRIIIGVALLFAMFQARGVTVAMTQIDGLVTAPETIFQLVARTEMIGGALICIWLARVIDRHGLGSGLLLMLATMAGVQLANLFSELGQTSTMGRTPEGYGYLIALYLILSIGALLLMDRRRLIGESEHRFNPGGPWPILLGTAGLSVMFLGFALAVYGLGFRVSLPDSLPQIGLAVIAVLTIVFGVLFGLAQWDESGRTGSAQRALLQGAAAGAVLAAICLAGQFLLYAGELPMLLEGANIAILVVAIRRIFEPPAALANPL